MAKARDDLIKALLDGELVRAARAGDIKQVDLYLQKGGDVNAQDAEGNPLSIIALSNGCRDTTKHLLTKGADVNARDQNGMPILIKSLTHKDNNGLTHALIDGGADVNACEKNGQPALFTAVYHIQDLALIRKMLSKGLDIMATNPAGQTIFDAIKAWPYEAKAEWSGVKKDTWRDYLIALLPDSSGPINATAAPTPVDPRVKEDTESAPMPELKKKPFTPGGTPATGGP